MLTYIWRNMNSVWSHEKCRSLLCAPETEKLSDPPGPLAELLSLLLQCYVVCYIVHYSRRKFVPFSLVDTSDKKFSINGLG